MIIYEGTNNLVSGAFLKCFSIECLLPANSVSTRNGCIKCYIYLFRNSFYNNLITSRLKSKIP